MGGFSRSTDALHRSSEDFAGLLAFAEKNQEGASRDRLRSRGEESLMKIRRWKRHVARKWKRRHSGGLVSSRSKLASVDKEKE